MQKARACRRPGGLTELLPGECPCFPRPLKPGAFLVFIKTGLVQGSWVPQSMDSPSEYLSRAALGAISAVYLDLLVWGCFTGYSKSVCNQVPPFPDTGFPEAIGHSVSSPGSAQQQNQETGSGQLCTCDIRGQGCLLPLPCGKH